jgi:hypothetical protein
MFYCFKKTCTASFYAFALNHLVPPFPITLSNFYFQMNEQESSFVPGLSGLDKKNLILNIAFKVSCTIVCALFFISIVYMSFTSHSAPSNFVQIRQYRPVQRIILPNSSYPNLTADFYFPN